MTLSELVDALSARRGPALTWYGADGGRTELGGPVVARWVAKIANLLGTDLAGDLFGEPAPAPGAPAGPGSPARVARIELGRSWQAVVWTAAAWLSGWEVRGGAPTDSPGGGAIDEGDATVWVVASLDAAAVNAAQSGVWVLAQDLSPLALSWAGEPLPEGVMDALGELMAQPDVLVVAAPAIGVPNSAGAPDSAENHAGALVDEEDADAPERVLLEARDPADTARDVLGLWTAGRSAVVVDDAADEARLERIAAQERAVWNSAPSL
ncbi:MAG: hypothetical protein LKI58_12485 [Actinomyces sp.]|jgi:hypothetical protein|nr:TIGR03089 family protein [Actinomyces sp.]MCI1788851.1 hypothetical protein [Actinomyces sp.]MCI1829525.1 hypothetical protein [Actinomyces sp.]